MHGVIFTSLRDFVGATHGADAARELFNGEPVYLLSESYPDERLFALVERAGELTGLDGETLLYEFGVFTAQSTFSRLYPAFFAISPSARDFLLTVETRIHELVRATIPHASPPALAIREHGDDGVAIEYTSPRHLCVLLRGLAEGTARHYGETTDITEKTCMRRGDPACTFEVRFSPTEPQPVV